VETGRRYRFFVFKLVSADEIGLSHPSIVAHGEDGDRVEQEEAAERMRRHTASRKSMIYQRYTTQVHGDVNSKGTEAREVSSQAM